MTRGTVGAKVIAKAKILMTWKLKMNSKTTLQETLCWPNPLSPSTWNKVYLPPKIGPRIPTRPGRFSHGRPKRSCPTSKKSRRKYHARILPSIWMGTTSSGLPPAVISPEGTKMLSKGTSKAAIAITCLSRTATPIKPLCPGPPALSNKNSTC